MLYKTSFLDKFKDSSGISRLRTYYLNNKDALTELNTSSPIGSCFFFNNISCFTNITFPSWSNDLGFTGGREGPVLPIINLNAKMPDSSYRDIIETQIKQKIDNPLFTTSIMVSNDYQHFH